MGLLFSSSNKNDYNQYVTQNYDQSREYNYTTQTETTQLADGAIQSGGDVFVTDGGAFSTVDSVAASAFGSVGDVSGDAFDFSQSVSEKTLDTVNRNSNDAFQTIGGVTSDAFNFSGQTTTDALDYSRDVTEGMLDYGAGINRDALSYSGRVTESALDTVNAAQAINRANFQQMLDTVDDSAELYANNAQSMFAETFNTINENNRRSYELVENAVQGGAIKQADTVQKMILAVAALGSIYGMAKMVRG